MKTFFRSLAGLFLVGILAVSCNKDEDKNGNSGFLKVGDTQYSLANGLIENYGNDGNADSCYWIRLNLVSSGIKFGTYPDGVFFPSGQGIFIILTMCSSHGESLDTGTYTYENIGGHNKTFSNGFYSLNWHGLGSTLDYWIDFSQGTNTVDRKGDIYKIAWNLQDVHGIAVTGNYHGVLDYFDYEDLYK